MNVTIVGTGYVGLVTGACLAELGNDVFCLDVDQAKVDFLENDGIPIHEPGLSDVVVRNHAAGRLTFTTDATTAIEHGEILFITVGTPPDEDGSADLQYVLAVASGIGRHFNRKRERTFWMDVRSAEFTRYAANAMLATRISFMNELADLADVVGVDIEAVRHGIGSDPRIGYSFLYAGCGYGGSCFPKDVGALELTAKERGQELLILDAVQKIDSRHFAVWGGLAFKSNTDDLREAPSRVLLRQLILRGATVVVYDPVAMTEARRVFALDFAEIPEGLARIRFADNPMDALHDADALAIVTEWKAFRSPDFRQVKARLKTPVIFDGRNLFEPSIMADAGIEYHGIGREAQTQP